ncbi:MAG: DNA primase [Bacteroidales bacterium]|nr:DNA primase [Candidatus Colicola caccequi]MBQ0154142.1 DNA primase [Candidatus Colicola equi]
MIPQEDIDEVLSRADLTQIIGDGLKKAGPGKYKCCCPFHGEKTPSFFVWTNNGTYKCFGCGAQGNAASFVMQRDNLTYPEAIRYLASEVHYTLHETKDLALSAEEKANNDKRELMRIAYDKVQRFFVANLYHDDPEAREALEYATKRWGADYIREAGIGYAYDDYNRLKEYAEKEHISINILIELGLLKNNEEKHSIYDFFRCRLMIPIRSISHQIIGYTARVVQTVYEANKHKEGNDPPKYINSTNSLVYTKDKSIFGLDVAYRQGAKEDLFYLVEGGPDVLRLQSIGVLNTVASLGSDWTQHQLQILHKQAHRLCLIPDIDKIPDGKSWGIGIDKVIATGTLALKEGFDSVSVIEIPAPDKKTQKRDADEYFDKRQKFDELSAQEFLPWYAAKLKFSNPEGQMRNLETIADLLSLYHDDYKIDFLLADIRRYIPSTLPTWRDAINKRKRMRTQEALKKAARNNLLDGDMMKDFGFLEKDSCYLNMDSNGQLHFWSNFVLHPLYHIKDAVNSSRIFTITNEDKDSEIVEFSGEELTSLPSFMKKVESLGNFIWLAKGEQLTKLKRYLYKVTESATLITQLGWQRQGFFAYGNGAVDNGSWYEADEYGIVRIQRGTTTLNFYLPGASKLYAQEYLLYKFERQFVHKSYGNFSLSVYAESFISSFGDNAKVAMGFLLAALFRDIIVTETKSFPLLNVFGPRGTGKSQLGHSLMAFFIIENTPPNIQTSTIAALANIVAQCANAVVHIDEYKNTIDLDKREFLKGLWDGIGRTRMNMDKDKKREITQVDSAIVLTGQEMPTIDNALFTRLIFLTTDTEADKRTPQERANYENFVALRKQGCSHLTLEILKYRRQFEENFKSSWGTASADLRAAIGEEMVESRLFDNWLVPLAAFHALRNIQLGFPFSYDNLKEVCAKLCIRQSKLSQENSDITSFWDVVDFLRRQGLIVQDSDYKIRYRETIRVKDGKSSRVITLNPPRKILYLRFKRIMELYQIHAKTSGQPLLPKTSIKYYLQTSKEFYFGESTSTRFKEYQQGTFKFEEKQGFDGCTHLQPIEITDSAYCIDYEVIHQNFNLTLETVSFSKSGDDEEPAPQVPPQNPQQVIPDLDCDEREVQTF